MLASTSLAFEPYGRAVGKGVDMGGVAFLEDGPRVLSIYEGFFSGGARVVHTSLVRGLEATTGQPQAIASRAGRPNPS